MKSTITLLVDNKAQDKLKQEHGLSILVEHKGKRILFDNGQNNALFYNAEKLNISLEALDIIILSHGHYDHGGNLAHLLALNPHAHFYAHPDCMQTRYSLHPNKEARTISLSIKAIEAIDAFPASQKSFITTPRQISDNIWLTGQIPRLSDTEDTGGPFYLDKEKKQVDLLSDDMSLWIENNAELIVICGCCHSGIMNTLEHIKQHTTEGNKIHTLLGGLHLVNANQQRLDSTCEYLNLQNIQHLYPAHCTGDNALTLLNLRFKNKLETAKAGLILTL